MKYRIHPGLPEGHNGLEQFLFSRGSYIWADDQSYIQYLLSPVIAFKFSHQLIILLHSLASFLLPVLVFLKLKVNRFAAFFISSYLFLNYSLLNQSHDLMHPETFVTPVLFLWANSVFSGKKLLFYLCGMYCLICKEDISIYLSSFIFFSLVFSLDYKIARKHLIFMFIMSCFLFFINLQVIQPYFAAQTCTYLGTKASDSSHTLPWLQGLYSNFTNYQYYVSVFFKFEVLRYLFLTLWPLIFLLPLSYKWFFLALAPIGVNIITGSEYLISSKYHYDHSVVPIVGFIVVYHLFKKRFIFIRSFGIFSLALYLHFNFSNYSMNQYKQATFWSVPETTKISSYKAIDSLIPDGSIVSAPSWNLPYFIGNKKKVYMFPNPFKSEYFGIYTKCNISTNATAEYFITSERFMNEVKENISNKIKREYILYREFPFENNNLLQLFKHMDAL